MTTSEEMKRIAGCFYGQVIGDALGVTCEFLDAKDTLQKISLIKKNHPTPSGILPMIGSVERSIIPGQFTDDTEMALSLARSLIHNQKYDKVDVGCAYSYWLCGTLPSDAGITTRQAVDTSITSVTENRITPNWRNELTEAQKQQIFEEISSNVQTHNQKSLSNGSLMRISPLAIAFRNASLEKIRSTAKEDALLTHANPIVGDAAATYCVAIAALIKGKSKEEAFSAAYNSAETPLIRTLLEDAKTHDIPVKLYQEDMSKPCILANGDTQHQGYLGVAFQAAFYHLLHARSFASGLEAAISRGGDTDTNGCIVAALLGARFGVDAVPSEWIDTVNAAEPCKLCFLGARDNMDLTFLSIKDADKLISDLANMKFE